MAHNLADAELTALLEIVERRPEGATAAEVARVLKPAPPLRTLQYRLKILVDRGRLVRRGERRWAKYFAAVEPFRASSVRESREPTPIPTEPEAALSATGRRILDAVRRPLAARRPVGYRHEFLDSYRPNVSAYLTEKERAHLRKVGTPATGKLPPGTYARNVLNRLLIDLSWNSSRLEGNTYSRLDTKRLIAFGAEAEGKDKVEAQMILNHKDAIEYLVEGAAEIAFDRRTIFALHAMLANNLLEDPGAIGRIRRIAVEIGQSVYLPLDVPQTLEEYFDQILATAAAIRDPFEQSLFALVQLPYLQPFEDVNKRVSRLAANIPLIRENLSPLAFTDVPRDLYAAAELGVYELNRIELIKDLYLWAYERSAARYAAMRNTLGEPDPIKLKYRQELREAVGEVVRGGMGRAAAIRHVAERATGIAAADRARFREAAEDELLSLHEGNYARFKIRPSEFEAWRRVW